MDAHEVVTTVGSEPGHLGIVAALKAGASVLLAGPAGSGKTHFLSEVARLLERDGITVRHLRPPLVPLPTVDRSLPLDHEPREGEGAPSIVLIDDAHRLDEATAAAVVNAAQSHRVVLLGAIRVPRMTPADAADVRPEGPAAHALLELWLRGGAQRVDLTSLAPHEAARLVVEFGAGDLDTMTRARIIALADGSRTLLRELCAAALQASRQGRDPLRAIATAPPSSRLGHAFAAAAAELPHADRVTLAVLARLSGIAHADAVRIVAPEALRRLRGARLIYQDGTPRRRITVHSVLARTVDTGPVSDDADGIIVQAIERMMVSEDGWWCHPLADQLAHAWLSGRDSVPGIDDVPVEQRTRVCLDAARTANDHGTPDLAAAFARLGLGGADLPALRIELALAQALEGSRADLSELGQSLVGLRLDDTTRMRWVALASTKPHEGPNLDATLQAMSTPELDVEHPPAEVLWTQANVSFLAMDWSRTRELLTRILTDSTASGRQRLMAAALDGLVCACIGDRAGAEASFERARRWAGDRANATAQPTDARLAALKLEIFGHGLLGTDPRPTLDRLNRECVAAAFEADDPVIVLAGLTTALAASVSGEAEKAYRELQAAWRRARMPLATIVTGTIALMVTRALAVRGYAQHARDTFELVDPDGVRSTPFMDRMWQAACACVAAVEGRVPDARCSARAAAALAAHSPGLLAFDLFRLIVLGEADRLAQLHEIAREIEAPAVRSLAARAAQLACTPTESGREITAPQLRLLEVWGSAGHAARPTTPALDTPLTPPNALPTSAHGVYGLTDREKEIALLVAEGLTNRQIASRLYLSVRTVESHIYQARAKVAVRTRGELGMLVRREETRAQAGLIG